jgi:trans-aconitate 2-methyltransferase
VSSREWDAASYDRVSRPQLEWGLAVLERLPLRGDERVLDAGCGSGRVTAKLAERLPRGQVVAVDASAAMVARAREALPPGAEVFQVDLLELELDEPVDAVFSGAVFHWIPDHERLFARLRAVLRPGGRLAAHCGGAGNVAGFLATLGKVCARPRYREFFDGWDQRLNFATPQDTAERLTRAGFGEVRCWLQPAPTPLEYPEEFLRAVCCIDHLERLPAELRDPFVADVRDALGSRVIIDYVRLQIEARAGG